MKTNLVGRIAAVAMLLLGGTQAATAATTYISAHSHWDVDVGHPYTDFEFKACYAVIATNAAVATSEIANLPHREQDAQNNMELRTHTDGFRLVKRIAGVATQLTSTLPNPGLTFGVGSDIMYDYVMVNRTDGSGLTDYDLYQLNADGTRGAHWYHWQDGTYSSGVSASYYTIKGWEGEWEFVHGFPLNGGDGAPHDLTGLAQDARAHAQVASETTFDDPTPANGDANLIVSKATFGLPSGTNYTYTIAVSGSGSGTFDFRDPGANNNSVFFTSSYYRLKIGNPATIQRFVGSTAGTTWTASSGGPGTYTLQVIGPDIYLKNSSGTTILHVNDGGPQSGLRVRVTPAPGQTWSFTGTMN